MFDHSILTVAQTLQSSEFLGRLAYENAAMIDRIELLADGSLSLVVGTFDDSEPNQADILEKIQSIQGARVGRMAFYEKTRGCAPGGSGCPTRKEGNPGGCSSGAGCGSSGGGCRSMYH